MFGQGVATFFRALREFRRTLRVDPLQYLGSTAPLASPEQYDFWSTKMLGHMNKTAAQRKAERDAAFGEIWPSSDKAI